MMSINVRARGLAGALAEMGIPQDLEGPQLNGVTELIETPVDVQPAPIVPMPSAEEVALFAQAARLGYSVVTIESIRQEIGVAIARHMINRVGNTVLQTARFSLTRIPLSALQEILGPASTLEDGVASWAPQATTVAEVTQLISPLLGAASGYVCAGSSRALQTASESCVRVLATLMPTFEITLDKDRMMLEFQYVLSDEMGELHPPKDENRNEIALSPGLTLDLRRQISADLVLMADGGVPLSAGYLRQLGREGQALQVEALMLNLMSTNNLALAGGKRRRADIFEVEMIMQQRVRGRKSRNFLVRWAGYHPSWEQWRVSGVAGEPVDTWETYATVSHTQALVEWRHQAQRLPHPPLQH